jgi:hypothetical protein
MKHISTKLMLAFLGMAVLTIALIWLVQAVLLNDSYLNERVASIDRAIATAKIAPETDYAALESNSNVNLLAVDANGSVVYQSDGLPMRGQIVRRIPELTGAAGGGVEYLQTETDDARYALLSRAVRAGYLLIVFSLVDVNEASRVLLQQLWVLSACYCARRCCSPRCCRGCFRGRFCASPRRRGSSRAGTTMFPFPYPPRTKSGS